MIVRKYAFVGHKQDTREEVFLEGGLFATKRKQKRGRFRGEVDECVDGGILIGVILT